MRGSAGTLMKEPSPATREIVSAMTDSGRLLICSCDGTVPLGTEAIRCGCHSEPTTATQLCGAELDRFRSIAAQDGPVTVACTQEAALFSDIAAQTGRVGSVQLANIRETAGWSSEGAHAGPKMTALLAAVAEPGARCALRQIGKRRRYPDLRPRRDG